MYFPDILKQSLKGLGLCIALGYIIETALIAVRGYSLYTALGLSLVATIQFRIAAYSLLGLLLVLSYLGLRRIRHPWVRCLCTLALSFLLMTSIVVLGLGYESNPSQSLSAAHGQWSAIKKLAICCSDYISAFTVAIVFPLVLLRHSKSGENDDL